MRLQYRGERMSRSAPVLIVVLGLVSLIGFSAGSAGASMSVAQQSDDDIRAAVSVQEQQQEQAKQEQEQEQEQERETEATERIQPRRKARPIGAAAPLKNVEAQSAETQAAPPVGEAETALEEEVIKRLDLAIEFVRPVGGERMQVRVNGRQVDPRTAFMILRLVEGHLGSPIEGDWRDTFNVPGVPPAGQPGRPFDREKGPPDGGMRGNGGGGPPGGRMHGDQPGNGQPRQPGEGNGPPEERLPFEQIRGAGQANEPLFITEPQKLTADLISTVMTIARDYESPEVYRRLEDLQLEATDEVFNRELRRTMGKWHSQIELYQKDRTGYDLSLKDRNHLNRTYELVMQYQQAKANEDDLSTQIIADELKKVIEEHFDIRQEQREHEYQKLSEDLAMLRKRIDMRLERRTVIVDGHLRRLLTDPVDF